MNRRAFLTALSAIPAVAFFPALVRVETKAPTQYMVQLHRFLLQMEAQGDKTLVVFVNTEVMWKLAEAFNFMGLPPVKVQHEEFECPWGFDIVGTPNVKLEDVDVSCHKGVIYRFEWDKISYVRNDPHAYRLSRGLSTSYTRVNPLTGFKRT